MPDPNISLHNQTTQHGSRKRTASSSYEQEKHKAQLKKGKKNAKTQVDESEESFKVCEKFESPLYAGFVNDGSLVVVERPWVKVMEALPPKLYRKRYGKC